MTTDEPSMIGLYFFIPSSSNGYEAASSALLPHHAAMPIPACPAGHLGDRPEFLCLIDSALPDASPLRRDDSPTSTARASIEHRINLL